MAKLAENLSRPLIDEVKSKIDDDVRNAAYKIIEGKGATFYGIAGGLCRICQAISTNEYAILTVSTHHKEVAGIKDVCVSMPTVIGKRGVHNVLYPKLNKEEDEALNKSAQKIKQLSQTALSLLQ